MSRRRRALRKHSISTQSISRLQPRLLRFANAHRFVAENLESRLLFSSAFDVTQLTALRATPGFTNLNGAGIGIAVLDTGVFAQNPDLQGNVKAFYDAVENPVNSPIDPNFIQDAFDHEGHGSHTSGIAASTNPAIGVAYGANLVDVRVLPDSGENVLPGDPVDRGLRWVALHAAQYNIKVVNMSLGFAGVNLNFTPSLDQYGIDIQNLEALGITVVSSSGNSFPNDPVPGASIPAVESTISAANTFSDSGIGTYDFTDYFGGPQWGARQGAGGVDVFNSTSQRSTLFNQLVAPGTDIYSTWNSPAQLHNTISGTSMSSPFIAGTVALMQQEAFQAGGSYLTPLEVLEILKFSADQITDPVSSTNVRAQLQPDGTLGPPQPLPGTGLTYDRVNVLHAMMNTQAFITGGTGITGDNDNVTTDAIPLNALTGVNSDSLPGHIGFEGVLHGGFVGSQDIDLYSVQLKAGGNLSINLAPNPSGIIFSPTLRLFDSTGTQIFSANGSSLGTYPSITTPSGQPLPVGTYYIGVSSSGNAAYNIVNGTGIVTGSGQGDYILNVTLTNPDPHGIPAAADSLGLTSPNTLLPNSSLGNVPALHLSDIIGQEIAPDGSTVLVPDGDVHFYSVVAPDTGNLIIEGSNVSLGADVRVFDSNNNPVGSEGSDITVPVTIGQVYYIGITTQNNAGFDPINPFTRAIGSTAPPTPYDLYVAFSNGDVNGTAPQAAAATLGTPITQVIGTDNGASLLGANNGNKDVDFYAFVAPTAGVIDFTASGASGFVPEMSLWASPNGISGVTRLADASVTSPQLNEEVTAGQTVLVAITGQGNQNFNGTTDGSGSGGQLGTYTLNSTLMPLSTLKTLSNNSIQNATPTPLTLGQSLPGNIGVDGNLVIGPIDVDIYSFTAPATRQYQFATNTSLDGDAATVLRIFDVNGNVVAANQSASAMSTNSVVSVPMTAGQTYYVGVSGVGPNAFTYNPLDGTNTAPGSTGPYTIAVTDAGPFQRMTSFQQGKKATYTDASGHKITVSLTGPGLGSLTFFSAADGVDLGALNLNGSDTTSTLTIHGPAILPAVTVNGSLQSLTASTGTLTGTTTISGALNQLHVAAASTGEIDIGSGGKLNAHFGSLTDESLTSAEPIASIHASSWTITSSTRRVISASSIGSVVVRGTFNEDVSADTIEQMTVGNLSSSAIRANVSITNLSTGTAAGSEIFVGIQSTLTTLPAATTDFSSQTGLLKSITVRGAFSNTQIAAWNIGNVRLNNVQTANSGIPFGVAADTIKSLRAVPAGGKPIILTKVFAPFSQVSLGGDAIVRILG
jgi:hypothetical protein